MKNYILLATAGMFILAGCGKKTKAIKPAPIKEEHNQTVIVVPPPAVKKEPTLGTYDWRANDELITQGSARKIVVVKSKRVMVLFDENNNILSRHRISLGKNNIGTKLKQGDYKTPEGEYSIIDKRRDKVYYKEILLDYPSKEDRERSKNLGFSAGGGITIHAQPNWNWDGHGNDYTLSNDWTEGCIAVTNEGMNAIWDMIALGTVIEIRE
jgi:murein L,D-transpeptidase YafK